jgi:hypothetical protein
MASTPCPLDDRVSLVDVLTSDLPLGFSDVTVISDRGEDSIHAAAPPTLSDSGAHRALEDKWTGLLGRSGPPVQTLAHGALAGSLSMGELRELWV